jgi:hypothetical protein
MGGSNAVFKVQGQANQVLGVSSLLLWPSGSPAAIRHVAYSDVLNAWGQGRQIAR